MTGYRAQALALAARYRTPLVAALVAAATLAGLLALSPTAPHLTTVVVAARDLAPGTALGTDDLQTRAVPAALAPRGSLEHAADALGRAVAGPVRAGETLTDVRLAGTALTRSLARGLVATEVRLSDTVLPALVAPGDLVDILAAVAGRPAEVAAQGARVVATGGSPVTLVVAVPPATAAVLAADGVSAHLSLAVRSR